MPQYPQVTDTLATLSKADGTIELHSSRHARTTDIWENVKGHGAKGDGVAVDRVAIQAAITASGWPNEEAIIFLPRGDYNLDGTAIVIDAGGLSSTPPLHFVGYGAKLRTTTESTNPMVLVTNSVVSATHVSFEGIQFFPNASNSPYRTCVKLVNAEDTRFTGCTFGGSFALGIDITGVSNYTRIENCFFHTLSRGINLEGAHYTQIVGNSFGEGLSGNPLNWIQSANGAAPTTQVVIVGNMFWGQNATLGVINVENGELWTIEGNTFAECDFPGVRIGSNGSSYGHIVKGNTFREGRHHDIWVQGGQRNVLEGNVFAPKDSSVADNTYANVRIENTFGGAAGHFNVISGNVSLDTADGVTNMISLETAVDYCVIHGNIGAGGVAAVGANNDVSGNVAA